MKLLEGVTVLRPIRQPRSFVWMARCDVATLRSWQAGHTMKVTHTNVLESLKTAISSTASSSGPVVQMVLLSFVLQKHTPGQ